MEAQESPIRKVAIKQADKTKGFRTRAGFTHSFQAAQKDYFDISWPYEIDMLMGDYRIADSLGLDNRLWVEVGPNTDLDAVTSGAALQNAVVPTDTEVILNALAKAALDGMLQDNGALRTCEVYFRLTSVPGDPTDFSALKMATWDSENSKLVSPDGSQFSLTAAAGDKVFITVRWEDGTYLCPGASIRIGDETLDGSNIKAGTPVRFIVENNEASAFTGYINIVYLHD